MSETAKIARRASFYPVRAIGWEEVRNEVDFDHRRWGAGHQENPKPLKASYGLSSLNPPSARTLFSSKSLVRALRNQPRKINMAL
jgi:hypothetical protein